MIFEPLNIEIDIKGYVTNLVNSLLVGKVITITSSNYQPKYGDTVSITVNVRDNKGNPLPNQTLNVHGTYINQNVTTNNQGNATFNYYIGHGESHFIQCENSSLTLVVNGWKEIASNRPHWWAETNGKTVRVYFAVYTSNQAGSTYNLGTLPEGFRPAYPKTMGLMPYGRLIGIYMPSYFVYIQENGNITALLLINSSEYGGTTGYGLIEFERY